MGTGRTQSSRGHNKALHYANPSMSQDGIATDVLQPIGSLPDIIALQAFSILRVCVKGTLVSFKKGDSNQSANLLMKNPAV